MGLILKIRPIGNSLGIIIPRKILELYNIEYKDKVVLTPDKDYLKITKVDGKDDKKRKRENK